MKFLNQAQLLVVVLVLTSIAVGCKSPQRLTPLPGRGTRAATAPDDGGINTRPIEPVGPGVGTTANGQGTTTGFPQPGDPKDNWIDDGGVTFRDQTVYFEFDKAVVKASEISKLQAVASRMKAEFRTKALRIEGHCDERGTEEYNKSLGERRALAVRENLIRMGLDPNMVETITYGEEKPADPGHNESAWKKNRRGEIHLLTPP